MSCEQEFLLKNDNKLQKIGVRRFVSVELVVVSSLKFKKISLQFLEHVKRIIINLFSCCCLMMI